MSPADPTSTPSSHAPEKTGSPATFAFGPLLRQDGRVDFRLYAPAVQAASLEIEGKPDALQMQGPADGWFHLTAEAAPGTRYRFVLPDGRRIADPASRFQPTDVHGPSEWMQHDSFTWTDAAWKGRPWEETVLYELHVGTFTAAGTYASAVQHLDHLRDLGINAIELMCLADFAGNRNWGYDGVFLFAPDSAYGRPDDLKQFINEAHARGIGVVLDVVYNHFGPEGNCITTVFPEICSPRHTTPWGQALNFDAEGSHWARELILENAVYWVREFHVDGLRLDASHAIIDESPRHILDELRERVLAAARDRAVHLILENEINIAERLLRDDAGAPLGYTAQWNHDITHMLAAVMGPCCEERRADDRGETERLGKALAMGFVIAAQEAGKTEMECRVPPTAFVAFVQTHDLVGNRIFGDRIHASVTDERAVLAISAICLLLPQIPMLFMGQEWAASTPFPFFCDYHGELGERVKQGRCDQLAKQDPAPSPDELRRAPDPQADSTMRSAQLLWHEATEAEHARTLAWHRKILRVRLERVVPLLRGLKGSCGEFRVVGPGALQVTWTLAGGTRLHLAANLCAQSSSGFEPAAGEVIWQQGEQADAGSMAAWSVCWQVENASAQQRPAD